MVKPARRTRDDLRQLILDAAQEVIARDGFGVMSSTITYKQVFDHLEEAHGVKVTRGSVHERIWRSQHDFQLEVLRRAARWDARESTQRTSEALTQIHERAAAAGWSTWRTLTEMVRVGGEINYRAADEDDRYFAWTGLTLALAEAVEPGSPEHEALIGSVTESYDSLSGDLTAMYSTVFDALGVRVRDDLFESPDEAMAVFTKLTTALSEGVSMRRRFDDDELPGLTLTTGPDGEPQDWHPFCVGLLALLRLFVEVDED